MDNQALGLNAYLQPINSPIANKQQQTQATTFERENILPTGYVNYTNLNQSTRPYTAVLSLSREAGTFTDIQEAITYVYNLGGGIIYVKPGTYIIAAAITMYSNINIIGESYANTIFDFNGLFSGLSMTSVDNVSIKNITFQNCYSTSGTIRIINSDRVTVEKCDFLNNDFGNGSGYDIYCSGSNLCFFDTCRTNGCGTHLYMTSTTNSTLTGGDITGALNKAISLAASSTVINILNTFFINCTQQIVYGSAITKTRIIGVTALYTSSVSTQYAIELINSSNISIADSTLATGGSGGIKLSSSCTKITIANNTIESTSAYSVWLNQLGFCRVKIVGNSIEATSSSLIYLDNSRGLSINSNQLYANTSGHCIQAVSSSAEAQVNSNWIGAVANYDGVNITDSSTFQIVGNYITGGLGSLSVNITNAASSKNLVVGNTLVKTTNDSGTLSVIANNS